MAAVAALEARALAGCAFEDILDGYFPLSESLRQLMERRRFICMWLTILHAPVMNISGLPSTAPAPLFLPRIYSGMIDHMVLSAETSAEGVAMTGRGVWFWTDGRAETGTFPPLTRLGEPAFVRGIGICNLNAADSGDTRRTCVGMARVDRAADWPDIAVGDMARQLGWHDGRAWRLSQAGAGIRLDDTQPAFADNGPNASEASGLCPILPVSRTWKDWDYLLINLSPAQANPKSLAAARRL